MCLAIYKPATVLPDWEAYREGFRSNSHGAGFAYVDNGQVFIRKGFFTFDSFREALAPFGNRQAAIHFRLATHGNRDQDNCHPFRVNDSVAMIHNGILDIACNVNKAMSDTWHYVELVLAPLAERDRDFFLRPELAFMGGSAIRGSKFVFLRADGKYGIWNESDGHWHADCWWSNKSYKVWNYYRTEDKPIRGFDPAPDLPDESEYRDFLSGEVAWAYDDMLARGYSASELDDLLREEGNEAFLQFAEECEYAEEAGL